MSAQKILAAADALALSCEKMKFGAPVTHVYNPLNYARRAHRQYVRKFASVSNTPKRAIFLGMNPGPWGMAQTGVPFGEVSSVRDFMGIQEKVDTPYNMHPKRLVSGFNCSRSEVSGRRLWGLFASHYQTAPQFFARHFVLNYCPLLFLSATDNTCANLTPDKLPREMTKTLFAECDKFLYTTVHALSPKFLIGVGDFAEKRLRLLFDEQSYVIGKILHPSPASPAANRGFADTAARQLKELGVW